MEDVEFGAGDDGGDEEVGVGEREEFFVFGKWEADDFDVRGVEGVGVVDALI